MKKDLRVVEPVALVGLAAEGKSTLKQLLAQGVKDIVVLDKNPVADLPTGVRAVTGEDYLSGLQGCKTAIRSAGVYPLQQALLDFQAAGGTLTSQIELFLEATMDTVVAVTGTLGKGSCVSMISHILDKVGKPNRLGGNFGVPALELLQDEAPGRIAILELSSFQLMTVSEAVPVAVVVRTTSEHLDWHKSVDEYRDAKANLVRYQKRSGTLVYCADAEGSAWIAKQGNARSRIAYGVGAECQCRLLDNALELDGCRLELSRCKVTGKFQLENMAAAVLAVRALGVPTEDAMLALESYTGLPYRLQFAGESKGIRFFNDSYATRPEATQGAVASFDAATALILGGSEKHADFAPLAQTLAQSKHLKGIALIGDTAARLRAELEKAKAPMPLVNCPGLAEAFAQSVQWIQEGGVVLLSPACASFGLFPNYKVRGERFDALVKEFCGT